jgi:endonuclease YncB( thermonuclease family)
MAHRRGNMRFNRPRRRRRRLPIPQPLIAILAVGIVGFSSLEGWQPIAQSFDRVVATSSPWSAPTTSAGNSISGHGRVRDGDTIVVSGVPVRLRGLHCPEMGTSDGERARREMVRLVDGAPVSCVLNGERTHDRQVGWCVVGGADLGAQLIRGGYCARCAGYDVEQRYVRTQEEAGPWRGGFPPYC